MGEEERVCRGACAPFSRLSPHTTQDMEYLNLALNNLASVRVRSRVCLRARREAADKGREGGGRRGRHTGHAALTPQPTLSPS